MAIYITNNQLEPLANKVDELVEQVEEGGGAGGSAFTIDLTGVTFTYFEERESYGALLTDVDVEEFNNAVLSGALVKYINLEDPDLLAVPAFTSGYAEAFRLELDELGYQNIQAHGVAGEEGFDFSIQQETNPEQPEEHVFTIIFAHR